MTGNIDALKSLLERRVDINGRNAKYETPLHRAADKENVDVGRLLSAQRPSHERQVGPDAAALCVAIRTSRSRAGAQRSSTTGKT